MATRKRDCCSVRFSTLVSKYEGKDKIARSIQYALKCLAYYMLLNPKFSVLGNRLNKSYKHISIGRKSFRLFRWYLDARRAYAALRDCKDPVDGVLNVVANISKAIWAVLDHYIWAFSIGMIVVPKSRQKLVRTRQRQFRIITACCGVVLALRSLRKFCGIATRTKKYDDAKFEKSVTLTKHVLDIFSYAKGAGAEWIVLNIDCHNGVSGFAGLLSSLIKVRGVWVKC